MLIHRCFRSQDLLLVVVESSVSSFGEAVVRSFVGCLVGILDFRLSWVWVQNLVACLQQIHA